MKRIVLIALLVAAVWKFVEPADHVLLGPGVVVNSSPIQTTVGNGFVRQHNDYTINEIAKFRITAKVLGKENYYLGTESDLSPTDLALGWQKMSDEAVLENLEISQSNRFYYWRADFLPIPRRDIETQSANMHLIPANDLAARAIKNVRRGEIIEIHGSLANVTSETNGWRWLSLLTRDDTGRGACELIWVDELHVLQSG